MERDLLVDHYKPPDLGQSKCNLNRKSLQVESNSELSYHSWHIREQAVHNASWKELKGTSTNLFMDAFNQRYDGTNWAKFFLAQERCTSRAQVLETSLSRQNLNKKYIDSVEHHSQSRELTNMPENCTKNWSPCDEIQKETGGGGGL